MAVDVRVNEPAFMEVLCGSGDLLYNRNCLLNREVLILKENEIREKLKG